MARIAYLRVSTEDQSLDRQEDARRQFNLDRSRLAPIRGDLEHESRLPEQSVSALYVKTLAICSACLPCTVQHRTASTQFLAGLRGVTFDLRRNSFLQRKSWVTLAMANL